MNYELSDASKDFWREGRKRLAAALLAWTTANMRFWKLGRNEIVIGQATLSNTDENYIFIMPGKHVYGMERNLTDWEQIHPQTVFLGYRNAEDLEPLMKLIIKTHRQALEREK